MAADRKEYAQLRIDRNHVVWGRERRSAVAIHADGINLFVCPREAEAGLASAVDELNALQSFDIDEAFARAGEAEVSARLAGRLPANRAGRALTEDIAGLAAWFADLVRHAPLRVRLETIETDSCRLFHVDAARLRLLVTYSGFGTQWVYNDNVRRDRMGLNGRSMAEANADIVPRPQEIKALRPWWIAIQKGEAYPRNFGNAIVHRSPPIRAGGSRRLRLCIDFA